MSEHARLEFRLLGPLELCRSGEPLTLGGGKQQVLLAVLLLHRGEAVSTERLIDALWGEQPPASAANSVYIYVSQLRETLGAGRLTSDMRGYLLHTEPDELDSQRFERLAADGRDQLAAADPAAAAKTLAQALALWRGPPLANLSYEDFARTEIGRLNELRLAAQEARLEAELQLGHTAETIPELEALVAANPLRERPREQLMLALYRSGRHAEALEAYRQAQHTLHELGLEPGPALRQLERAILSHDPALQARAPAPRVATVRRGGLAIAAGGIVLGAVAVVAAVLLTRGGGGLSVLPPSSVGVIDARSYRIVAEIPIAGDPERLATRGRSIWVGSDESATISEIDPRTHTVTSVVSAGGFPGALAVGRRAVWVVDGRSGTLAEVDPIYGVVAKRAKVAAPNSVYDVSRLSLDSTSVAVGFGSVWTTDGSRRLVRFDPGTGRVVERLNLGAPLDGVAAGAGALWVISGAAATAIRVGQGGSVAVRIPIVSRPNFESPYPIEVSVGEGFVWVLDANTATVTKIDPGQRSVAATLSIGVNRQPVRLAVGAGAAWVANRDGTLARIDAATNAVTTIPVGHNLRDVAVADGAVWVIAGSGLSSSTGTSASTSGNLVRALPGSSCSPIYYTGNGHPEYLIASDLPLQAYGTTIGQLSQAIEFVLKQRGFRAGHYAVGYQSCDDSTAQGYVSPPRCAANAREYAEDTSVIGVVGAFNSGCSQAELATLNRAPRGPLAMISPTNTYVGLTRAGPGTAPGEPGRYYPTGIRNYVRVVATDNAQGTADAIVADQLGVHRVYLLHEPYGYGRGLAAVFAKTAIGLGIAIAGSQTFDYGASSYAPLVDRVAAAKPDALFIAGILSPNTATMVKELRAALGPRVRILATDGFSGFPLVRILLGTTAEGMLISEAGVPNSQLPAPGRKFVTAFSKAVDETPGSYPAYAAQAAEALLDAIARSHGTRASVTAQLFKTRVSNGILGSFAIDRYGDTTAATITVYRFAGGAARVFRVITPKPSRAR